MFTFGSHPNSVLTGGSQKNIYTPEEKAYYFASLGIDILLEYPFTKEFASVSPEDFVYQYKFRRTCLTQLRFPLYEIALLLHFVNKSYSNPALVVNCKSK